MYTYRVSNTSQELIVKQHPCVFALSQHLLRTVPSVLCVVKVQVVTFGVHALKHLTKAKRTESSLYISDKLIS